MSETDNPRNNLPATDIRQQPGTPPSPMPQGYHVKILTLQRGINRGERISILLDGSREPVTLANEYMLCGKRLLLSPNTYFNHLSHIALIYKWADEHDISVAQRLLGGIGFADYEVSSIFATVRKRQRRAKPGTMIVGKSEQRARMVRIKNFVISGMETATANLDPRTDTEKLNALEYRVETTRTLFKQTTPSKERSPSKKGLTAESVQLLADTLSPGSANNPWRKPLVQHRNFILVMLYLVPGCRRGDLAKVKLSDIVHGQTPYVRFDAHVSDPNDRRPAEPRLKTLRREYPIHTTVADAVSRYIAQHRVEIPNATDSEYLFLETSEGRELAMRTVNAIFETLQSVIPDLTPHILRHTKTESLLRDAEAMGLTETQVLETVMYLNGWRTDNRATYTARKREEVARRVATARKEEFFVK